MSQGSSPRVRGKQHLGSEKHGRKRLIPACAGKTMSTYTWTDAPAAHPRVCGENGKKVTGESRFCGSSPRVRGKHPVLRPSG